MRDSLSASSGHYSQLFDMLARVSTSVSIAGFTCRIRRCALRRYRPDDESGS
jgi:hypothetical protein